MDQCVWISFPVKPKDLNDGPEGIVKACRSYLERGEGSFAQESAAEFLGRMVHLVTVKDFYNKPSRIMEWLDQKHELILTHQGKVCCYIRPYDEERDLPLDGPSIELFDGLKGSAAKKKRAFLSILEIPSHSEEFIKSLKEGFEFVIVNYPWKLAVATRTIS